jgi:hypothetical protein
MTDLKIIVVILLILGVLDLTRRGRRHRRRHFRLSVRETVPVGRNSWITFGHRVNAGHTVAVMAVLVVILAVAVHA